MGHVSGWKSLIDLTQRLGDLQQAIGDARVVPAPWEPFYKECPSCRYFDVYSWAQEQLQNPDSLAMALALFAGEPEQLTSRIGHANYLILCTKTERSQVTRRLMLAEALELWESYATEWLDKVVGTCAELGISTSPKILHQHVLQALGPVMNDASGHDDSGALSDMATGFRKGHGFDKELMQMDGWTPDPGLVILPVDGGSPVLMRQILRLDLRNVVLFRARQPARVIAWENVTLIHVCERALTLEIRDAPPMIVAGYKNPEQILATVQVCYKAATERILQAIATKVIRTTA